VLCEASLYVKLESLTVRLSAGARVSEIVTLELDDLRLDDSAQIRLQGKGGKERACPLWPETAAALKAYLDQRTLKGPDTQRVFCMELCGEITMEECGSGKKNRRMTGVLHIKRCFT
jgi:site-specific recombinase XerC